MDRRPELVIKLLVTEQSDQGVRDGVDFSLTVPEFIEREEAVANHERLQRGIMAPPRYVNTRDDLPEYSRPPSYVEGLGPEDEELGESHIDHDEGLESEDEELDQRDVAGPSNLSPRRRFQNWVRRRF